MVKREGGLPIGQAIEFTRQAALALAHAHENGLIHRDVKPSNFLLTTNGQIKLMDLGLAKSDDDTASLTMMHNETLMGTADYLSPEQALNSHEVDHRTDIYSLGGTLFFMVAGHPPFPEGSIAQRIAKHQSVDPPELTSIRQDCPRFVADLCQRMMRKKPAERCQSGKEIAELISKWQQTEEGKTVAAVKANSTPSPAISTSSQPVVSQKNVQTEVQPVPPTAKPSPVVSANAISAVGTETTAGAKVDAITPKNREGMSVDTGEVKKAPLDSRPVNLGPELVRADSIHLNLPEQTDRKIIDKPTSVEVGTQKDVAAEIHIKTEVASKKKRMQADGAPVVRRRTGKRDAIWILSSLGILLLLAAAFMIWAFVFQASTTPPVAN